MRGGSLRPPRATESRVARAVFAAALLGILGVAGAWWALALVHRGGLAGARTVAALGGLALPPAGLAAAAGGVALAAVALARRPALARRDTVVRAFVLALVTVPASLLAPLGVHSILVGIALVAAVLVAVLGPEGASTPASAQDAVAPPSAQDAVAPPSAQDAVAPPSAQDGLAPPPPLDCAPGLDRAARRADWHAAIALWALVVAVDSLFSMHRHAWFGSGSWDMGCMVHNVYRASRFLDLKSTVLGNSVGDHFMAGIYLLAPLFWVSASGYMLLFVQAVSLGATAPAIFLIARHHGASRGEGAALGLAAGLAFGLQSAAYFDVHEITLGFGALAFALHALERRRLGLATVLLATFALFKESLGAYVAGLGVLALALGLVGGETRLRRVGAAWLAGGVAWFVLVNRVILPRLWIAHGQPLGSHDTFTDFGATVGEAALGMATHPLKALGAVFVPEEKTASLLATFGGLGYLTLFAPEVLLAAAPLFLERFLSSKATMWEMGYHYAAPLTLYAAWGAARGWPRARALAGRVLAKIGAPRARPGLAVSVYVLAAALLIDVAGYRHPANFLRWREDYFSTPDRRAVNARAVALLDGLGRDASIAAQNRLLPHLADRAQIYRLEDWTHADWVLLSVGESAWPYDDGQPARLARQLAAAPEWRLVFSEGGTAVFGRVKVTALPAVRAAAELGLPAPLPSRTGTSSKARAPVL